MIRLSGRTAGGAYILERNPVHVLHAIHEAFGARLFVAFCVQIADIRVFPKQQAELRAARARRRRVVREPFVHEPMGAAHELRTAAARPHVAEERMA